MRRRLRGGYLGVALLVFGLSLAAAVPRGGSATGRLAADTAASAGGWTAPTLVVQGFTPQAEQVQAILTFENLNQDASAGDIVFEVAALAENGNWLGFGQSVVWLLAPGERTSTIFTVQLPDGGAVTRVEARLRSWQAIPHQPLVVSDPALAPGEPLRATARIRSPYSSDVENVRISAVAFGEDGAVAGAGLTFLGVLAAGDERTVEIPLTVTRQPARVDVFAVLTSRSTLR